MLTVTINSPSPSPSPCGLTFRYLGVISLWIIAIIIHQVIPLHPLHCLVLLLAQPPRSCPARLPRQPSAPAYFELLVLWHERLVTIICFVFPILCRPLGSIPYRSVNPQWPYWESRVVLSCIPPNRDIVYQESVKNGTNLCQSSEWVTKFVFRLYGHDIWWSPSNGVVMEILRGIKPEMELHFSSDNVSISTSSDEDVCLESVRLPWCCSQEFEVNFVVVSREILVVWELNQNELKHG